MPLILRDQHGVVLIVNNKHDERWYSRGDVQSLTLSYGSNVSCSSGLNISDCNFLTSDAKTTSAGAVESMQFALMEITACPPFLRKWCALSATIRA